VLGLFHLAVIIIALALLPAALSVATALGALAMCALIVIAVVAIVWWLLVAHPTLWVLILGGAIMAIVGWYGVFLNLREVRRLLRQRPPDGLCRQHEVGRKKTEDQPHAQLTYAPGVEMPRQIETKRATVPSPGGAGV
jgi:hypothetical protein